MKKLLLIGFLFLSSCASDVSETTVEDTLEMGAARPYLLRVPKRYDAAKPASLIVVLHGFGGNNWLASWYFSLNQLADSENTFVASLNGTQNQLWVRFWNATDACCNFTKSPVDDVAYFNSVVDEISSRYSIDAKRIFVVGHSNGGFMAHRLACDSSTRIAAIVSLAGAIFFDSTRCQPSEGVAILQVHGDADQTISYDGGRVKGAFPTYPSSLQTTQQWASLNGCSDAIHALPLDLDLEKDIAGNETLRESFEPCQKATVERWTIRGGKHTPALSADWPKAVYHFLKAHPKP